jgi:hypothetical protein
VKVGHWKYSARKLYGVTLEQYEAMLQAQGGVCAICAQGSEKKFAIDHDHSTGRVRGLLCIPCNVGIANLKESVSVLKQAISYLQYQATVSC